MLEVVQVKHRRLFIAEVLECYVSDQLVETVDGKQRIADLPKLDPIIYALDNHYYRIGNVMGIGYHEGVLHKTT